MSMTQEEVEALMGGAFESIEYTDNIFDSNVDVIKEFVISKNSMLIYSTREGIRLCVLTSTVSVSESMANNIIQEFNIKKYKETIKINGEIISTKKKRI